MFDVCFPSNWSGLRTALWCIKRKIGHHIVWVNINNQFQWITVLTLGKFKAEQRLTGYKIWHGGWI